jgi:hypothetical protein
MIEVSCVSARLPFPFGLQRSWAHVAEAASLTVLQGSEYCHANDDSGQQCHDQPPLPGAWPPAETYPLPSKPRFMFWHSVPLKLRYLACGANSTDAVGAESLPGPRSSYVAVRLPRRIVPLCEYSV